MDIKETISGAVKKITSDKSLLDKFKKNPADAVKSVIGVDVPDDVVKKIIEAVKAKIGVDGASGLIGKVKGIFKK